MRSSYKVVMQMDKMGCVRCGGTHNIGTWPISHETVEYIKHHPYSNTYNSGWKNQLNFGWGGLSQQNYGR